MKNQEYEINSETYAIKYRDEKTCLVIGGETEKVINKPLKKYLDYNCSYFGSSLEGRIQSSKLVLGMKYKLPIIMEESRELIFFPTTSLRSELCTWISLNNIKKYEQNDLSTVVTFINNKKYTFDISIESFENQFLRASKLLLNLKIRKKELQK